VFLHSSLQVILGTVTVLCEKVTLRAAEDLSLVVIAQLDDAHL
jgi:hypothetical protein